MIPDRISQGKVTFFLYGNVSWVMQLETFVREEGNGAKPVSRPKVVAKGSFYGLRVTEEANFSSLRKNLLK